MTEHIPLEGTFPTKQDAIRAAEEKLGRKLDEVVAAANHGPHSSITYGGHITLIFREQRDGVSATIVDHAASARDLGYPGGDA